MFAYLSSNLSIYFEMESMSEAAVVSRMPVTYVDHSHSDEDSSKITILRWLTLDGIRADIGIIF